MVRRTKAHYTKKVEHEGPFRPNNPGKSGKQGTLQKFPLHMANPKRVRKRAKKGEKKEEAFMYHTTTGYPYQCPDVF